MKITIGQLRQLIREVSETTEARRVPRDTTLLDVAPDRARNKRLRRGSLADLAHDEFMQVDPDFDMTTPPGMSQFANDNARLDVEPLWNELPDDQGPEMEWDDDEWDFVPRDGAHETPHTPRRR